ncbi:MAG: hypothetical protein HZA20_13575 [Nitrospirae bacterium]|nr:hypothetical protein [Nitrospirota bacterium]
MIASPASAGLLTVGNASMDGLVSRLGRANSAGSTDSVGQKFEALFASQLMKEITKMMPEGGFLPGGGLGNDIYETMIQNAMADEIARKGTGMGEAFARMTGKQPPSVALSQNNNAADPCSVARDTVHVNSMTHSNVIDGKIREKSSGKY